MLQALKAQLEQLAQDPKDPFFLTIKKIVGAREAVRISNPLRKMVLALPDMIDGIRQSGSDSSLSPTVRRLQGFALAYLFSPTDYLPEKSFGLFGYVDDAYLIANVYERSLNEASARGMKIIPAGKLKLDDVRGWIEIARRLLPNEMISIDQSLQGIGSRPNVGFGTEILKAANTGPSAPALRKKKI